MLNAFFCCDIDAGTYSDSSEPPEEITMKWFPVLSGLAIVLAAFLGIDNPGRAIVAQLGIAFITFIGMGIGWWKESRYSTNSI